MKQEIDARRFTLEELKDGKSSKFSLAALTFKRTHKDVLKRLPERELDATVIDKSRIPVPKEVVKAAQKIAEESQHKFLTTWLPKAMGKNEIIISKEDRERNADIDFNKMEETLYSYRDNLLKVETTNPDIHQDTVSSIRSVAATNRITHAVVKETVGGVNRLLWVGSVAGIAEEVLQKTFGANPFIYAITSTIDNLAAISAEGEKLFHQGYSKKEAITAMITPAAIMLTATGASFIVDNDFKKGKNTAAGLTYGAESGICIFPSIFAAITSLRPEYEKLVREGKVFDPVLEKFLRKDKLTLSEKAQKWIVGSQRALGNDLAYPHHAGLYIGATVGIGLSAIAANIPMGEGKCLMQNPLVLVPLGVTDSVGGAIAGTFIDQIYDRNLKKNLKKIQ